MSQGKYNFFITIWALFANKRKNIPLKKPKSLDKKDRQILPVATGDLSENVRESTCHNFMNGIFAASQIFLYVTSLKWRKMHSAGKLGISAAGWYKKGWFRTRILQVESSSSSRNASRAEPS